MKKELLAVSLLLWAFFGLGLAVAKVNINTAGPDELQTLNGIGPAKAADIIDYRNTHGPFARIEDIQNVTGIKTATFDKIKDAITVEMVSDQPENDQPTINPDTSTTTGNLDSAVPSNSPVVSAHSSQAELSVALPKPALAISAGRPRLAAVGSPVKFRGVVTHPLDKPVASLAWRWSFGDASTGSNASTEHAYTLPGIYQVVVTAREGEEEAVSRTTVEVVAPQIKFSAYPGYLELANADTRELNLGGWQIQSPSGVFTFPTDTLLAAQGNLKIPTRQLAIAVLAKDALRLSTPDGQIQATTLTFDPERQATLSKLAIEANELALAAANLQVFSQDKPAASVSLASPEKIEPASSTRGTSSVIKLNSPQAWWQKIIHALF